MQATTPWGGIQVSWISKGEGRGEIHVNHGGALKGHEAQLEKIVTTLKGRTKSFNEQYWVIAMRDGKASEATAKAFLQAIITTATRADAKTKKALVGRRWRMGLWGGGDEDVASSPQPRCIIGVFSFVKTKPVLLMQTGFIISEKKIARVAEMDMRAPCGGVYSF